MWSTLFRGILNRNTVPHGVVNEVKNLNFINFPNIRSKKLIFSLFWCILLSDEIWKSKEPIFQ